MPPKQRFTHDIILDKAYEILQASGMNAINARSVSKALNCSTQPIFSYFPDMGGLRKSLTEKAVLEFNSALEDASLADNSIINRCKAYINFARKSPNVFKYLLSMQDNDASVVVMDIPEKTMAAEKNSTGLSEECLLTAFTRLNTYSTGLAIRVISGKAHYDEEQIQADLESVYKALIISCNI